MAQLTLCTAFKGVAADVVVSVVFCCRRALANRGTLKPETLNDKTRALSSGYKVWSLGFRAWGVEFRVIPNGSVPK